MVISEIILQDLKSRKETLAVIQASHAENIANLNISNIEKFKKYIDSLNTENDDECFEYFDQLYHHYTSVAIFPIKELIESFCKVFSIQKKHLYIIENSVKIIKEIDRINDEKVYYVPISLFLYYYYILYLPSKIRAYWAKNFKYEKMYDGKIRSLFEISYFKTKQNIKYKESQGVSYPTSFSEECIINVKELLQRLGINDFLGEDVDSFLEKDSKNNLDYIVKELYYVILPHSVESKKVKKEEYLFNLFRLILADRKWLSKDEFDSGAAKNKYGEPIGIYSNSYKRYQTVTMRKFLKTN